MKKRKTKKKHWVRHLLLGFVLLCMCAVFYVGVRVCSLDAWNEFNPQKITGADETLILYDNTGNAVCKLYKTENRISVPLSSVPDIVRKAFISAEDARFYEHKGLDIIRIGGALIKDIKSGGYTEGASTISQQLIKLSHLSSEKTIKRKAEEAVLATLLEYNYSKDRILEMYLNYVYFGAGCYGIEAASERYFGKTANELTAAEGALLAGILKSPTNYAPHIHYEKSVERQKTVLRLMHDYGYLSDDEYEDARNQKTEIKDAPVQTCSFYTDYVQAQACKILDISKDELLCGGYRIYTAQDTYVQSICDEIYADNSFFPADDVQSAICVVDCETGYIDALIGGRGTYTANSFNRATDLRRQPGSCIKPLIVYAPAIEYYGYTAASVIQDEPRSFGNYTPKNSGNKYYGNVTLRKAVKSSLNIPAVTVLDDIGVENGKRFAHSIGIDFDEKDTSLALALGGFTYGVSPLQIANAYSAICDGFYTESKAVIKITDKYGNTLYNAPVQKRRVLSDQNAFILTDILCSVAEDGTGHRLSDLDFDVACKTGTVSMDDEHNRDAWIAAYTEKHSVAVWMGYDNSGDGAMTDSVTGGSYPAEIVKELFSRMYTDDKPYFNKPDGIISVKLDAHALEYDATPALATYLTPQDSVYEEYFVKGTEPDEICTYWELPLPPFDFACTFCSGNVCMFTFTADGTDVVYELVRRTPDGETVIGEYRGATGSTVICGDNNMPQSDVSYFIRPYKIINDEKLYGAESAEIGR